MNHYGWPIRNNHFLLKALWGHQEVYDGHFLGPKFKPSLALFGCCILHPKYTVHGHVTAYGAEAGDALRTRLTLDKNSSKVVWNCVKAHGLPKVSSVVEYIRYDFFDWYVPGWAQISVVSPRCTITNTHNGNIECAFWSVKYEHIRLIGKVTLSSPCLWASFHPLSSL